MQPSVGGGIQRRGSGGKAIIFTHVMLLDRHVLQKYP